MGAKIELIAGQRFNSFIILGETKRKYFSGGIYYDCLCDCSRKFVAPCSQIRNGRQSCGCLRRTGVGSERPGMVGETFHRWTVLKYVPELSQQLDCYLCQCSCSTTRVVPGKNLRNGRSKSCGCFRRDVNACRVHDPYEYKADHKNREREWILTDEEKRLVSHYAGVPRKILRDVDNASDNEMLSIGSLALVDTIHGMIKAKIPKEKQSYYVYRFTKKKIFQQIYARTKINIPYKFASLNVKLARVEGLFYSRTGKRMTLRESSLVTNLSETELIKIRRARNETIVSLDVPVGEPEAFSKRMTLGDFQINHKTLTPLDYAILMEKYVPLFIEKHKQEANDKLTSAVQRQKEIDSLSSEDREILELAIAV